MAKVIARNASIGIDDSTSTCRALTALFSNITLTLSAETPEATGFGETSKQRLQDGMKDGELKLDAFFDSAASKTDEVFAGILGASTRWSFGPSGSSASNVCYTACAILSTYDIKMAPNDAATVSATFVGRSGSVSRYSGAATWGASA